MSDLVTIAVFPDRMIAHILRGRLESEGIFAAVMDEAPSSFGGVRVLVNSDDVEMALKIKKQINEA
jgi:hypothetical protein